MVYKQLALGAKLEGLGGGAKRGEKQREDGPKPKGGSA
jgi:hypothetical protein